MSFREAMIRAQHVAPLLLCAVVGATDLERLAAMHSVAGAEDWSYLVERLGAGAQPDALGVSISFGSGSPRTLIAAGIDEPGFVVSGFTDEGHLRLQRLAEPPPQYQFDSFWVGRRVIVTGAGHDPLPGVIAAPSVHFASDRGYGSRVSSVDRLFVDVGASNPDEARAAGIRPLDRVVLDADPIALDDERLAGPWVSSYSGAAVLLSLADRLRTDQPKGTVTLRFVAQQHFHNTGFLSALSVESDQTVLIRSGGASKPEIMSLSSETELMDSLLEQGESLGFRRGTAGRFRFGPFETEKTSNGDVALMTLGVENAGSPVEIVRYSQLASAAALLANLVGLGEREDWRRSLTIDRPAPQAVPPAAEGLERLIRELADIPGISGDESAVRHAIESRLPDWARKRAETDQTGNLIVKLGGPGDPTAVFIAHMDEIGFEVTRMESDGRLALKTLGGGAEELFAWHPLTVYGANGPLAGVMEQFGSMNVGADSPQAVRELGVDVGAKASVPKRIRRLLGSRISGRGLDDRVGCAVLLAAIQELEPSQGRPVWLVFSVREETGLVGAQAIASRTSPKRVYAIDSFVTSDSPLEERRFAYTPLGEGAVIRGVDNSSLTPLAEVERVLALARAFDIPLRPGVTAGGNDGSRFIVKGAANIPLTFPLRYAHTAVETADLRDIEALHEIVGALIQTEISMR